MVVVGWWLFAGLCVVVALSRALLETRVPRNWDTDGAVARALRGEITENPALPQEKFSKFAIFFLWRAIWAVDFLLICWFPVVYEWSRGPGPGGDQGLKTGLIFNISEIIGQFCGDLGIILG